MLTRQCSECSPKSSVRSLGQVQLCGALHLCWQTRKGVNGQYMVCVLYKDALCLATAEGLDQHYMVQACISLNTVKIEEADNGRGKLRLRLPCQPFHRTDSDITQASNATQLHSRGSWCSKSTISYTKWS